MLLFSYYPADPRPRRAAEALVQEGMQVDLLCLRASRSEPVRETVQGVRILRLPLRRRRGGAGAYVVQYAAFIVSAFFWLAVRSLRHRLALVHVHNMPDVLVFSALVPKALGAKVILDLHDPMPELMMTIFGLDATSLAVRVLKRLERWSTAFADVVFTVNLACKRIFGGRSCEPDKIRVIMNTPDEEVFVLQPAGPRPSASGRFVLMYHGSILERNGPDLAVEALAIVRKSVPESELRIYGEATPFLQMVMETARRLGVAEAVQYLGPRDLNGIVAAIDECDVGIIPNRRTMFTEINTPTRIFEYLSRGKPVVTGRGAGVEDYFGADALFYFELGDPADLARCIAHVCGHPADVARVVERGQDVYRAHRWRQERSVLVETMTGLAASQR